MNRYQVIGPPIPGRGAYCPLPSATMEAVSGGSSQVIGAPGTKAVIAPHPSLTVDPARAAMGSSNAPDFIAPSIYVPVMSNDFSPWRLGGGGGRPLGYRNPLPMPAVQIQPVVRPAQRAARTPSRAGVTATPRPLVRWKVFGGKGRTVT